MSDLPLVCTGHNKRPVKNEEMRRQAAREIVESMIKAGVLDKDDGAVEDIVKATRYGECDGYKIAKELDDRSYWSCDMEIVTELDGFGSVLDRIFDAAEDIWAKENPREPQFSEGESVIWRGKPATVHGVYEYRPQRYKVRQGEMSAPTSYYIVPFEDVSAVGSEGQS